MLERGDDHQPQPRQELASQAAQPQTRSRRGLSTRALRALRIAATLASVATDLRVRVGDGVRTAVEVRRPPTPRGDECVVVPPCHFRTAVGRAHAQDEAGQPVEMTGLDGVCDPVVEIGLAPSDAALPGDVYRLNNGDEWTFIFATTLDIDAAMACCVDLDEAQVVTGRDIESGTDGQAVRIGFHRDDLTEVTLVHTSVPELHFARAERHLKALHEVLARCATDELLAELNA